MVSKQLTEWAVYTKAPNPFSGFIIPLLLGNCGRFMWVLNACSLCCICDTQHALTDYSAIRDRADMLRLVFLLLALLTLPAASAETLVRRALDDAFSAFRAAAPHLGSIAFGVDVAAYGDALRQRRFNSAHWDGVIVLDITTGSEADAACKSFAAYVTLPPREGRIALVTCPQFRSSGTDPLRRLTILHEMVHVVAGPDECRAMAFAARVEQLALGQFTPVERYWRANGCHNSGFSLP
jgi:hypothetical protein